VPATYCEEYYQEYYQVQEDERRAGIVNPAEKIMDAAGIEPVTSR
jgi:hypothetical protein